MDDTADPFDSLAAVPNYAGTVAQEAQTAPDVLETPDQTEQRVAGQQKQAQQVWSSLQVVKAKDLQTAGIPSYTDSSGTTQPVTDSSGAAVTDYDKKNNVGWDSQGNPVQVKQNVNAPPSVEDAFAGLGTTTDKKTGDQYKIRAGLPWQWQGQDPDIAAQAQQADQDKAVANASTALGRKLTLDERQYHVDNTAFAHQSKAMASTFGLDGTEDLPTAQKKISDSFNNTQDGYGSPQANETEGYFGSGPLTPEAQAYRDQLDQKKAAALQQASDLSDTQKDLATRKATLDQQETQRQALAQMQVDTANRKLTAAGVTLQGSETATDTGTGDTDNTAPRGTTDIPQVPSEVKAQAIQDAAAGKKPYSITQDGALQLSDQQPLASIQQAVKDGLLPQPPPEVMAAAAQKQKFIEDAGSHPEIKAALAGAGRGAAFLAGAPVGAGAGALIPGLGETGIGELAGGLVSGSLAAYGYSKLIGELGKYNSTINSFVASQQLHPGYSAAGEFAAFGAGLPKALMKGAGGLLSGAADTLAESSQVTGATADAVRATIAQTKVAAKAAEAATGGTATVLKEATPDIYFRASDLVDAIGKAYSSSGGGLLSTIQNLSDLAATAAAQKGPGFAAAQVAKRVGIAAAGMVAIDTTLKEGSKALGLSNEGQTWGGVTQAAVLGAFASGHGIAPKDYDSNAVGDIILRGMAHDVTGTDPSQTVDMSRLASTPDIGSNVSARMTHPLTPEEQEIYSAFNQKASQLINEGKLPADPSQWQAKAKQILFAGRKGGVVNMEITPKAPEAAPEPPPSVAQQLAAAEAQPSPVETAESLQAERAAIVRAGAASSPDLQERLKVIDAKLANLPATQTPAPGTPTTPAPTPKTGAQSSGGVRVASAGSTEDAEKTPAPTVDDEAHRAVTSPVNPAPEPTDAQKEAGNYQMGHPTVGGLPITIEHPIGSKRREDGPTLTAHYGYVKGTVGADGDHVDAFVKGGTPTDYKGPVFVVNQTKKDGSFDEHKAVIGASSPAEAQEIYDRQYNTGFARAGSVATFSTPEAFKAWAEEGDKSAPAVGDVDLGKLHPKEQNANPTSPPPDQVSKPPGNAGSIQPVPETKPSAEVQPRGNEVAPESSVEPSGDVVEAERAKGEKELQRSRIAGYRAVAGLAHQASGVKWSFGKNENSAATTNTRTGEVRYDPDIIERHGAQFEAQGADKDAWLKAVASEEDAHARGIQAARGFDWEHNGKTYPIQTRIWAEAPKPVQRALLNVYGAENLSKNDFRTAGAELEARIYQREKGLPITEATLPPHAADAAALDKALSEWELPHWLQLHLDRMDRIQAIPGVVATSDLPSPPQPEPAPPEAGAPPRGPPEKPLTESQQAIKDALGDLLGARPVVSAPDTDRPPAAPFYAKLPRVIEAIPQQTMTVAQAKAAIAKGAKPDEIKMSGIVSDPLSPLHGKQADEKVTREQLRDYAIERQATAQDVTLGVPEIRKGAPLTAEEKAEVAELRSRQFNLNDSENRRFRELDYKNRIANSGEDIGPRTHFATWQLPGAEPGTYREQFVTWPENKPKGTNVPEGFELRQVGPDHWDVFKDGQRVNEHILGKERAAAWANKQAIPEHFTKWSDGHGQYKDITNPIVRLRRNIRTDANGNQTLFLEEMQGPNPANQEKMPPELRKRIYEIGMKRAIREAAEVGATHLGWTTGQQQADRYSLEKQISSVHAGKLDSGPNAGRYVVSAKTRDGSSIHPQTVEESELEHTVGKELARRIIAEADEYPEGKEYSGLDLKVGGEGLKNLYDVTLPRIANEIAKKFGGKVGKAKIVTGSVANSSGLEPMAFDALPQDARDALNAKAIRETKEIHSLELPPELRKKAIYEGFPLLGARPVGAVAYDAPLPADKMPGFIQLAQKLSAMGVNTPEGLAADLSALGPKAPQYSQSLWHALKMVGAKGPSDPDWDSIYSQPAAVEDPVNPAHAIAETVAQKLGAGESIDRRGIAKLAQGSGLSPKEVDEAAELGIVKAARAIATDLKVSSVDTFAQLVNLYERQPNLTAKTSTSKINQAYSTPAPLAWVADVLAKALGAKSIGEPTAGNGMLLIGVKDLARVQANEIDTTRVAALKNLGLQPTQQDAIENQFAKPVDALLANPPFGTVQGSDGTNKVFPLFGTDKTTKEIDQAIVLRSLQSLTDDGRAALIVGGKNMTDPRARADAYLRQSDFWNELYGKYRVIDHFTVNGDLYTKQGAGWPVDVILIAGKGQSPIQLPSTKAPRILDSWDALKNELTRTDEERVSAGKYDPAADRAELGSALSGIRDVAGASQQPRIEGNAGVPSAEGQRPASGTSGGSDRDSGQLSESGGSEAVPAGREGESRGVGVGSNPVEPFERGQQLTADFRVPYKPASALGSLGIFIPRNMETPVQDYLAGLKSRVGDLDKFVREKLGYAAKDPLGKYFSAEQIDAIASAIDAESRGDAMVIGHQGGVGKGRIAAGLIRYARERGLVPIFATKDEKLYAAMMNDLADTGSGDVVPLFTNNKVDFEDKTGKQWKQGDARKIMQEIAKTGTLPEGSHALFTTYDQIKSDVPAGFRAQDTKLAKAQRDARSQPPPDGDRMKALRALMPKAFFILDESHLASGDSITGWRTLPLVMAAKSAYYSSATFAKRPDSMPIYGRTSIRQASTSGDDIVAAMRDGGVPLQQVVSAMLAQDGLYSRLERDFSGTRFSSMVNQATAERDIRIGDAYTGGLREILSVSNQMKAAVEHLNGIIRRVGKSMGVDNTPRLESTNFASKLHNLVSQYLTAIKAEAAVQRAHLLTSQGDAGGDGVVRKHKVIIALQNTMESPINDLIASGKPLSFNGLLSHYLDTMRVLKSGRGASAQTVTITDNPDPRFESFSDRELEVQMMTPAPTPSDPDNMGINEGVVQELFRRIMAAVFTRTQEKLDAIDLEDMPISPIDYIRNKLEKLGVRTGEITGRGRGVDANGQPYERKPADFSKKAQLRTMSEFNNSDLDALILNASGSTGISLHSSKDFKNTSPREMLLLQPHLDINEFMQTLWRIDRTGQVYKPSYTSLQTALAAEKRPAAITLRKMASLNANTTSNAENEMTGGAPTADIFNKYGDEVMHNYLRQNREFVQMLAWPQIVGGPDNSLLPLEDIRTALEDDGKLVAGVTGRGAILPNEEAAAMWEKVESDYSALISYLNELGQNDLLSDTMDIKAKTLSSEVLTQAKAGTSAFDGESRIEKIEADTGAKPLTGAEAAQLRTDSAARRTEATKQFGDAVKDARTALEKTQQERAPDTWEERKPALRARIQLQIDTIKDCLEKVGQGIRLENDRGLNCYGVVSDVKLDEANILTPSKQIFTVVINTTKKKIKLAASQLERDAKPTDQGEFVSSWDATAQTSNIRHVVTGNLLAAYIAMNRGGAAGGNIVNYTTADGKVRQGIMMPPTYAGGASVAQREIVKDADHARAGLQQGKTLASASGDVTLQAKSGDYELRVPASRQSGGKYWRNTNLLAAMDNGVFVQKGQEMVGRVRLLPEALKALTYLNTPMYLPVGGQEIGARPPSAANVAAIQARIAALQAKPALTKAEQQELADLQNSLPTKPRDPEADATAAARAAQPGRASSMADRRAAAAAQAREAMPLAQKMIDRVKAAGEAIRKAFLELPPVTDYKAAKGEWLGAGANSGTGAKGLQRAAYDARMMSAAVKRAVPNPVSRMAISRYIEADGDLATLRDQAAQSPDKYKPIYERAVALSPEEKAIADQAKTFFDDIGANAVKLGILSDMLEGYVAHFVDQSSIPVNRRGQAIAQTVGDIATSRMKTRFDRSIRRVFANLFELEKQGYRVQSSDIAEVMAAYAQEMNNVVSARTFVKQLSTLTASDGRPLAVTSGYARRLEPDEGEPAAPLLVKPFAKPADARDYLPIDHPALRKYKWVDKDAEGNPTFVEGEMLIHPEIHQDLANTLGQSALNKVPLIRAVSDFQHQVKNMMLGWSLFHYVQEGTHAIGHGVNPFKLHRFDPSDPLTRELINGGLMLVNWDAKRDMAEGLGGHGGLLSKIPGIGPLNDQITSFLFQDYIPGLKAEMARHAFERNLERFKKEMADGKVTRAQVAQKTAQQANDAFGEQNTRYAGENPTHLHAERMAFLAPDFLKSRLKFFADAFTKYGGEQRRALIILALTMAVTAKLLERMLTGRNNWKNPFSVKTENREYELRSVPGDVLEMMQSPRWFISGRLSPLISRTALEAITGRDYRGMKRTFGEQLMDLLKEPIPMSVRGGIDKAAKAIDPSLPKSLQGKLTTNTADITGGEQVASAMGARIKRYSDVTQARILGHEWRQRQGLESDDTVYPPSKFVGLKDALEDRNLDRARAEYKLLVDESAGHANAAALAKGFRESMNRPFSGGAATERAFVSSLDKTDRATYDRAVASRNRILSQFASIAGPTKSAAQKPTLFEGFPD